MAKNTTNTCGICDLRHISKPAYVWCTECDEGLCKDCNEHHSLSKATRHHNTIKSTDYNKLPPIVSELKQFCEQHNQKYQIFCEKHNCPCCSKCIVEKHKDCKDIKSLDDLIKNVKTSVAFSEVESSLKDVTKNIATIREDRKKYLTILKDRKNEIEKEIKNIRQKINDHLDKLQNNLLSDITDAENYQSRQVQNLLVKIEERERNLCQYQNNISNIKQHASDLQTFLIMKRMEADVSEGDTFIHSLTTDSESLQNSFLVCKMNKAIEHFLSSTESFGTISTETHYSKVNIVQGKDKQAQVMLNNPSNWPLDKITATYKKERNAIGLNIRGCFLMDNGKVLTTCYRYDKIRVLNTENEDNYIEYENHLYSPCDIACINNSTFAVTSSTKQISIVDVKSKEVKETIRTEFQCFGVTFAEGALIYCAKDKGLKKICLGDHSTKDLKQCNLSSYSYVTSFQGKFYYTNNETNTVTCCDGNGRTVWEMKNERELRSPLGISVDGDGYVYVVCWRSSNVVLISPDGKQHRQLLSRRDGLRTPQVLHYNRSTNQLLVVNQNQRALFFDISRL